MDRLPLELTKALHMRFMSIFGEKFLKLFTNDGFVQIWWEEWSLGMAGIDPQHIKAALDHCRLNLEWPPSIAEFRRICEQSNGLPSVDDAFNLALRRDFTHPLVKAVFDQVGSWSMTRDKEDDLKRKFKSAYEKVLQGERHPQKAISVDEPPKVALDEPKAPIQNETLKVKRQRLLDMSEQEAGKLPISEWYERVCYFREIEALQHLRNVGNTMVAGRGQDRSKVVDFESYINAQR